MNFQNPDINGYYGEFGGAFVPEMLFPNVDELQKKYIEIIESEEFQTEFQDLLKNYVGRATPLYFSKNLSKFIVWYFQIIMTKIRIFTQWYR